jgi:hypothetical protein
MLIWYFFQSFVLAEERVQILYGDDTNIVLSILVKKDGQKSVRFIDKRRSSDFETLDTFSVTKQPTLLQTSKGLICGKTTDPGVIACDTENENSLFSFVDDNGYVNLKTKNSKCLTKTGIDRATNGFYLNLSTCKNTANQRFYVRPVESTPVTRKVETERSYGCPTHEDYTRFMKSNAIVETELMNIQMYLDKLKNCRKEL